MSFSMQFINSCVLRCVQSIAGIAVGVVVAKPDAAGAIIAVSDDTPALHDTNLRALVFDLISFLSIKSSCRLFVSVDLVHNSSLSC